MRKYNTEEAFIFCDSCGDETTLCGDWGEYCEPCYHKLLNEEYNKLTELEKDEIFSYYGSWDNLTVFEKGDALIGEIKDVPYDELLEWAGEQEQEAREYAYELKCEREFDEYWSQR